MNRTPSRSYWLGLAIAAALLAGGVLAALAVNAGGGATPTGLHRTA